jgi:hypothetical protein
MVDVLVYEILKWVLVVFVAGFIGYFGKYLSKIIIAKFSKKKKQEAAQTIIHKHESAGKYKAKIAKQKAKLEKKRLKALKKKRK